MTPFSLRDRLQAAYLAREPGTSWEERMERTVTKWHEDQIADLRTLVVEMAERHIEYFQRAGIIPPAPFRAALSRQTAPPVEDERAFKAAHAALSRLTQRAGAAPKPPAYCQRPHACSYPACFDCGADPAPPSAEPLSSLLEKSAQHQMTPEEIARQRASWARGQAGWDESAAPAREAAP